MSGWIEWNLFLDMDGGPRWCEKKGYGGTINIDAKKGEAYKQPSFYAIGHFSKLVPPDSLRIGHSLVEPEDGLSVLTVQRPDNRTVLIVLNTNTNSVVINVSNSEKFLFSHEISSNSIQSLIWS